MSHTLTEVRLSRRRHRHPYAPQHVDRACAQRKLLKATVSLGGGFRNVKCAGLRSPRHMPVTAFSSGDTFGRCCVGQLVMEHSTRSTPAVRSRVLKYERPRVRWKPGISFRRTEPKVSVQGLETLFVESPIRVTISIRWCRHRTSARTVCSRRVRTRKLRLSCVKIQRNPRRPDASLERPLERLSYLNVYIGREQRGR